MLLNTNMWLTFFVDLTSFNFFNCRNIVKKVLAKNSIDVPFETCDMKYFNQSVFLTYKPCQVFFILICYIQKNMAHAYVPVCDHKENL